MHAGAESTIPYHDLADLGGVSVSLDDQQIVLHQPGSHEFVFGEAGELDVAKSKAISKHVRHSETGHFNQIDASLLRDLQPPCTSQTSPILGCGQRMGFWGGSPNILTNSASTNSRKRSAARLRSASIRTARFRMSTIRRCSSSSGSGTRMDMRTFMLARGLCDPVAEEMTKLRGDPLGLAFDGGRAIGQQGRLTGQEVVDASAEQRPWGLEDGEVAPELEQGTLPDGVADALGANQALAAGGLAVPRSAELGCAARTYAHANGGPAQRKTL